MLVDEAKIKVEAGRGGNGIASFRREKYISKGGPDGGDGGRGGDVIFRVDASTHGLSEFATKKTFEAKNGQPGMGKKKTGKSSDDMVIAVPPGTLVYADDETERLLADLRELDEEFIIAKGGKGGLGNVHFASSTNQTPREFTEGEPGEEKTLRLELRLIADVGIIGLPNAGKSTFLARVSAARPKIAEYAFTTLEPNLGVAEIDGYRFVMADIPGLIEGAAKGKGLGHEFLRHVLRTKLLVHLISADNEDALKAYETVHKELAEYGEGLEKMSELVVISKVELISDKEQRRLWQDFQKHNPIFLSSATGRGVNDLLYAIKEKLEAAKDKFDVTES